MQLLATYVLNSCRGKRVDRENRDAMLRKLAQILKAHGPVDLLDEYRTLLSKPRTMTKAWADPGAERLGVDRQVMLHPASYKKGRAGMF